MNVLASGRHDAAWKTLPHPEQLPTDIDEFIRIAQLAERGLIDALFLADGPGGLVPEAYGRPWRALDPLALHAALSQATQHIGLVVTTTSLFGHPYTVARQIASLDHISKGRAAWNIITSQVPVALKAYGIEDGFDQRQRYERAAEFTQIVTSLWDSLPNEAIVADAKSSNLSRLIFCALLIFRAGISEVAECCQRQCRRKVVQSSFRQANPKTARFSALVGQMLCSLDSEFLRMPGNSIQTSRIWHVDMGAMPTNCWLCWVVPYPWGN